MGYFDEKHGDIIQALCPVKTEISATSSESSGIDLDFHTDFNFDKDNPDQPYNTVNPDYIILLCLRSDHHNKAYTSYADARTICKYLTSNQIELMRKPAFQFAASYSFTQTCGFDKIWSTPSPLLKGPEDFPEVSIDLLCGVRGIDDEADAILTILRKVCNDPRVSTKVCLRSGDILIIDNRKGAHARTAFTAYFDGNDRWVHRVYVRRSLWELRKSKSTALRVF